MRLILAIAAVLVFSAAASAQTLEDRIKTLEDALARQQQVIDEQKKSIEDLKAEIEKGRKGQAAKGQAEATPAAPPVAAVAPSPAAPVLPPASGVAGAGAPTTAEVQKQVKDLEAKVNSVVEAQTKVVPSIFNPSVGLVGETIFSYNNKRSSQTGSGRPGGFDAFQRSVELNAAGSVDPFASGYVVLNASVDPVTGEAHEGVEEAAIYTTSLPWNLQVKAGRFFGEFGRLSYIHDHELPFVNRPLVLDQYIGGESKTDGVQVNYLLPIPHYVSLTVGTGTQFGNTPNNVGDFRNGSNLNFFGRVSTYFDLTPNISLETGLSGLWNPSTTDRGGTLVQPSGSTFTERERRLGGIDFALAYRPLRNNEFKSITWGNEVLRSDNLYDVAAPAGPLSRRGVGANGLYSYLAYRFHRQWVSGFLFEWLENETNNDARTSAYSPYITFYPSHWSQLRLQYTHTNNNVATGLKPNDAVYLQWAWIIGSHAHGWQQR